MSVTMQRNASRPRDAIVWHTHGMTSEEVETARRVVTETWVQRDGRPPEKIEFLWVAEQYTT